MPSILKIRIIKARNLTIPGVEEANSSKTSLYYSTLKLIESTELLEESVNGSSTVLSGQISSSSSSSSEGEDSDAPSSNYFSGKSKLRTYDHHHRVMSPANFTFRTKSVPCPDGAPKWDQDFRLEVSDDAQLQDTPLQLHVYGNASTWIGSLTVDLNPLLARDSPYGICGWFPLNSASTGGGGGEIFLQAKIQFFGDSNPFKESSAGIQFFCSSEIPSCIKVTSICRVFVN